MQTLDDAMTPRPAANAGISHTRWATHGPPNHANAHPHVSESGTVAIVHNGVIGNAAALRTHLRDEGVTLASDTDSEIIAHLVQRHLDQHRSSITAALEAGREVSVASTKVVTNMQIAGIAIAAAVRDSHQHSHRDADPHTTLAELRPHLDRLPHHISATLAASTAIREAATVLATFSSIYYLGREGSLPVVREGALKLKEISYLHAEAYHSAELKHGPLALVSVNHASVVVLTDDEPGTRSEVAISQTAARGGTVVVLDHGEQRGHRQHDDATCVIAVPSFHPLLDHILTSVTLQLERQS